MATYNWKLANSAVSLDLFDFYSNIYQMVLQVLYYSTCLKSISLIGCQGCTHVLVKGKVKKTIFKRFLFVNRSTLGR